MNRVLKNKVLLAEKHNISWVGHKFNESDDHWQLDKNTTVDVVLVRKLLDGDLVKI